MIPLITVVIGFCGLIWAIFMYPREFWNAIRFCDCQGWVDVSVGVILWTYISGLLALVWYFFQHVY